MILTLEDAIKIHNDLGYRVIFLANSDEEKQPEEYDRFWNVILEEVDTGEQYAHTMVSLINSAIEKQREMNDSIMRINVGHMRRAEAARCRK